jgi:hypothetical protein
MKPAKKARYNSCLVVVGVEKTFFKREAKLLRDKSFLFLSLYKQIDVNEDSTVSVEQQHVPVNNIFVYISRCL